MSRASSYWASSSISLNWPLLFVIGPPADHLGIDLVWSGVTLGVNMQTSFVHPPFGFVLFYLRAVGPAMVTHYKAAGSQVDPNKVNTEIQQPDMPPPLDSSEPPKMQ